MSQLPWWASESFWRKTAIWVTAGSFVVLIFLTLDSLSAISAGGKRVPAYAVINLLNLGMVGMVMAMLIAGYEQSQIERAIEGSSWAGYFVAQARPWFVQGITWRQVFGGMFAAGFVLLVWDMLTIGRSETRPALAHAEPAVA
ncbi:MAG TPA: hypothetical protein VF501_10430 [Thiobacillus sp.]